MKKAFRVGIIATIALVILLGAGYCLLGVYYMVGFPCFTWINGIYCTGKTVYEVNNELCAQTPYDGIAVLDKSGARLFVSASDVGMTVDYTESLNEAFYNRKPLAWGAYVFQNLSKNYEPVITIDRDKLEEKISDWEIFVDPEDFECHIVRTPEGYKLENTFVSVPDRDKVSESVYAAMYQMQPVLDLETVEGSYRDYDLRGGAEDKMALFHNIDRLQRTSISYVVGDEIIVLDSSRISDFILTKGDYDEAMQETVSKKDPGKGMFIIGGEETALPEKSDVTVVEGILATKDHEPIVSESRMYAFFQSISDKYDTSWMLEKYRKGEGTTVIVNESRKGDGKIFDIDAEFAYLRDEMINGDSPDTTRNFELSGNAVVYDADENLGSTYIEVNMGNQMLYYYVDGELSMDMPVVTGNINRSRGTPTGIFPVYNKRYHTYLRGDDYVSYVNYWLGVNKGVGIHDATWRSKFGEEIYKSDGSHGCINCPLDTVSVLWDVVEVGTPVILYY